jgi:hypothetical protein
MPLIIEAKVTDTPTQEDKRAAEYIVTQENARRAALDPPEDPLPMSTNGELKNSYEVVLTAILVGAHASYINQSDVASLAEIKALWGPASDAQRNAARSALK